VILLLAQVGGCVAGELVDTADSSYMTGTHVSANWPIGACGFNPQDPEAWLTEGEDGAAAAGEDAQCTNVLFPGGVLDPGCEDTGGTGDHGALDAGLEGIDRVVVVIVTVGRHFSG
jgi:hypothetical protein